MPITLAALAVVAIAAVAATLPDAAETGAAGEGSFGGGGGGGLVPTPAPPESDAVATPVDPLAFAAVILAAAAALLYLLSRRRDGLRAVAGVVAFVGVMVLAFWLVSSIDLPGVGLPGSGGPVIGQPAGESGGDTTTAPPSVLLVVLGLVLVGALALVIRAGRVPDRDDDGDAADANAAAADVGKAASRAADRIEASADPENEIYRAWREMTRLLDVSNPRSATPGEFAAAGIDAGMERGHVEELTRLFEDVRYGGDDPSEPMERRAVAVLRRIEAAYDPDGGDG